MAKVKNDLGFSLIAQEESKAIEKGLKIVSQKLIAEEKARNGYLIYPTKKAA